MTDAITQTIAPFVLPTGKAYISYSEISEWARCSWKHKLKHVDKIVTDDPSPYLVFGSAVHACCESILRTRAYDVEQLKKSLTDGWKQHEDVESFKKWKVSDAIKEAIALLDDIPTFLDETFPGWTLADAEARLFEPIKTQPGVSFKGFIDCVIAVPTSKGVTLWVLDWKTSNRGWFRDKKSDPITLAQVVLYRHHLANRDGFPEISARCGFIVLNRSAKPGMKCELVKVSAGPVTVQRALKMVDNAVSSIRKGIAIKNKGDACKWCEFSKTPRCP